MNNKDCRLQTVDFTSGVKCRLQTSSKRGTKISFRRRGFYPEEVPVLKQHINQKGTVKASRRQPWRHVFLTRRPLFTPARSFGEVSSNFYLPAKVAALVP